MPIRIDKVEGTIRFSPLQNGELPVGTSPFFANYNWNAANGIRQKEKVGKTLENIGAYFHERVAVRRRNRQATTDDWVVKRLPSVLQIQEGDLPRVGVQGLIELIHEKIGGNISILHFGPESNGKIREGHNLITVISGSETGVEVLKKLDGSFEQKGILLQPLPRTIGTLVQEKFIKLTGGHDFEGKQRPALLTAATLKEDDDSTSLAFFVNYHLDWRGGAAHKYMQSRELGEKLSAYISEVQQAYYPDGLPSLYLFLAGDGNTIGRPRFSPHKRRSQVMRNGLADGLGRGYPLEEATKYLPETASSTKSFGNEMLAIPFLKPILDKMPWIFERRGRLRTKLDHLDFHVSEQILTDVHIGVYEVIVLDTDASDHYPFGIRLYKEEKRESLRR